jgi:hypothetical protein
MSEKKTMSKRKTQIIAAIIGALGLIIAALIPYLISKQSSGQNMKPLNFVNWTAWGGINAVPVENTVTLSAEAPGEAAFAAGYRTAVMDTGLKGKIVVLEIENETASEWSNNCLVKITANAAEEMMKPQGISPLVYNEYIPTGNARIEFQLPSDFDGNLGFTFTRVTLRNLKITAYYK